MYDGCSKPVGCVFFSLLDTGRGGNGGGWRRQKRGAINNECGAIFVTFRQVPGGKNSNNYANVDLIVETAIKQVMFCFASCYIRVYTRTGIKFTGICVCNTYVHSVSIVHVGASQQYQLQLSSPFSSFFIYFWSRPTTTTTITGLRNYKKVLILFVILFCYLILFVILFFVVLLFFTYVRSV